MKEKGFSVYRLSKLSGVPYSTLSDLLNHKTLIENISLKTAFHIAKALDVGVDFLYLTEKIERIDFELFKSFECQKLKYMGDCNYVEELIKSNEISACMKRRWYPEAFYLLGMLDYLKRINKLNKKDSYDNFRTLSLNEKIFPSGVITESLLLESELPKKEAIQKAIPEFLKYNIVEGNIRNVA